jgi:UDP-glucose 4-epimerase
MSILLTGGAGYVGSHMALALVDAGEGVVVVDDLSTGVQRLVPGAAAFVAGDVGDPALLARTIAAHGVDTILHLAASVVVPESVADPLGYYLNNTEKTRALLQVAIACGVRQVIFSSTAAVYGMTGALPVAEDAPLRPLSPYGASKMMSEMMLADAARAHGVRYVVLRYFNVAGADPQGRAGQSTPRATHLIKVACEAALGQRSHMEVFGTDHPTPDGTCIRDYIQVTDLARAHLAAVKHLRGGGASDVFNCGYGRGFSVLQVIDAVQRLAGRRFDVRRAAPRPGDPAIVIAKADRIRRHLNWTPEHDDLDTIVHQALRWQARLASSGTAARSGAPQNGR